jgi:uncharacterized protein (DUF1501 family)
MCDRLRFRASATRRDVLKTTLAATGLMALGSLDRRLLGVASGAVASQSTLTVINMLGGNDGLSTVIPRNLQGYYDRRPTIAIPPGQELSLAGGPGSTAYGLHPRLPKIRALWDEGRVAIVNLVGYPDPNLSHFESEDIWSFGLRNGFAGTGLAPSGWIARYADQYAPTSLGAVSLGLGRRRDFNGGSTNPLLVGRLSEFRFSGDGSYANNHLHRLETVRAMLGTQPTTGMSGEAKKALDAAHQLVDQVQAALASYSSTVVYPNSSLGRSMQDVARLVQAGFPTRVFYTGYGGFDTHSEQNAFDAATNQVTGAHATLMQRLDDAVGAFADDTKAMGAWSRSALVVISEFGRRNFENGSNGTDHGHGACVLVIGGGVNGGVYGPDVTEAMLQEDQLEHLVDFRDVYRELLTDHLGAGSLATVFPEAQQINNNLGIV